MSEYKRMVSYLYKYERGKKGNNAGYVRIDIRKGNLKLVIHAQDDRALKDKKFQVYFYYHDKGVLKGVLGGEMTFVNGESQYRQEMEEASVFGSGYGLDKMSGMLIYYNTELAYGTEWDDQPILVGRFEEEKKETPKEEEKEQEENMTQKTIQERIRDDEEDEKEQIQAEQQDEDIIETIEEIRNDTEEVIEKVIEEVQEVKKEIIEEETEQVTEEEVVPLIEERNDREYEEIPEVIQNNSVIKEVFAEEEQPSQQMIYPLNDKERTSEELTNDLIAQSPKINHMNNHQIMFMVRIHPQDIGKLAICNWHFGSNSFLIHGYYQFHYIILGKIMMLDGSMKSIIGVPGSYTNQEHYMASQFGFRDFLPVKPTQIKTGAFGYWIAKLN